MDLTGSYIGIWFTREEIETIFGLDPLADATVYMLRGQVLGESENVGLWVEVHGVAAPPEITARSPRSASLRSSSKSACSMVGTTEISVARWRVMAASTAPASKRESSTIGRRASRQRVTIDRPPM